MRMRTSDWDQEQDNRSGSASGSELGSGPWIRIIIRKRTQDLDWVLDQNLDQVPDYNEDLRLRSGLELGSTLGTGSG